MHGVVGRDLDSLIGPAVVRHDLVRIPRHQTAAQHKQAIQSCHAVARIGRRKTVDQVGGGAQNSSIRLGRKTNRSEVGASKFGRWIVGLVFIGFLSN